MERLTKRNEDGTAFYPYCFLNDTCGGMGASEKCNTCGHNIGVCERLAAYEDAGLTPEEIVELKEFYGNPLNTAVPAVNVTQCIPVEEQLSEQEIITIMEQRGNWSLACKTINLDGLKRMVFCYEPTEDEKKQKIPDSGILLYCVSGW